ncbi:hypothetical protein D3C84_313270 [compost metagenome]
MNKQKQTRYGGLLTEQEVLDQGFQFARQLPDGTWLAVAKMIYNGRLFVDVSHCAFEACYCYKTVAEACAAMMAFDPEVDDEPQGWFKDPKTNRIRPEGDKSRETVGYATYD